MGPEGITVVSTEEDGRTVAGAGYWTGGATGGDADAAVAAPWQSTLGTLGGGGVGVGNVGGNGGGNGGELDPVAAWGRKLYATPGNHHRNAAAAGLMFGLHHHHQQDAGSPVGGLGGGGGGGGGGGLGLHHHHHHHHHHQVRGPVTGLKEEPLSNSQLSVPRSWMQPSIIDQSR